MKRKIVSMILALSLVISGLPMNVANAAEPDENQLWQEETTNVEKTTEVAETISSVESEREATEVDSNVGEEAGIFGADVITDTKTASRAAQGADYSGFHVNNNGKAVGSDGVTYDDVMYLSADTVAALDAEVQADYIMLCDVAANWAQDGIEDIVIAVDENGFLNWSCYVPSVVLAKTQRELIEGVLASETETEKSTEEEELSGDRISENEESTDTATAQEVERTEAVTDGTVSDKELETQSVPEKMESEDTTAENVETESSTTEDSIVEETATEDISDESESMEVTLSEELTVEEPTVKETAEEEPAVEETTEGTAVEVSAENMDLLPVFVNEQIEVADEVDVNTVDLGYGMKNAFNSTLPSGSYFSKQLTATELKVYNMAHKRLIEGNTTFEIPSGVFDRSTKGLNAMMDAAKRSLSVIVLTDTEKVEWFAIPGGFRIKSDSDGNIGTYDPVTNKIIQCTIELDKSPYYSKTLDDSANTQITKLVIAAQEYALKEYPASPAYGVVRYFDKWICENNYYNTPGGVDFVLGPEVYYYCHSSYGSLLKGYAVCESYAKAMSRLMDAVGIPNMYVTGLALGEGHAWNYVQMPDGKWYLLDSTWNNPSDTAENASQTSTREFFLSAGDRYHTATGSEYEGQSKGFMFAELSTEKYPEPEGTALIELNKTTMDLAVKQKFNLSCDNAEINNAYSTWSSSNVSVAKVDAKGNVTAVAPGTAVIKLSTLATAGVELKAECVVQVYQVKDINSARTGKASDTVALGTNGKPAEINLNVNVGSASPYTAQEMVEKKLPISNAKNAAAFEDVKCTSSKTDIADAKAELKDNTIKVTITPKNAGASVITINFGGKKTTIKVTVGELIDAKMFDIDWTKAGVDEKTMSIDYTGKAVAPKVTKKSDPEFKAVKFKATYLNNKNAGKASVIISGTGKYGGEIRYDFQIKKLPITKDNVEFKLSKAANVYNAGSNPAKAAVKYVGKKKVGLKLNTDYQIVYKNGETETTNPVNAGEYSMIVRGIGSYEGECTVPQKYTITQCEINKAKVTFALSNKVMVPKVNTAVMLGKNVLPKSEYEIKYYSDKEYKNEVNPIGLKAKTTYYVEITAKDGGNMKAGTKKFTKTIKTK